MAFNQLWMACADALLLAYPDLCLPFIQNTDSSNMGLGVVLSQAGPEGKHVVVYFSWTLISLECTIV